MSAWASRPATGPAKESGIPSLSPSLFECQGHWKSFANANNSEELESQMWGQPGRAILRAETPRGGDPEGGIWAANDFVIAFDCSSFIVISASLQYSEWTAVFTGSCSRSCLLFPGNAHLLSEFIKAVMIVSASRSHTGYLYLNCSLGMKCLEY